MTAKKRVIHWFRNDLRLEDNPALWHAQQLGDVLPVFIWDTETPGSASPGAASKVWLHHSLASLNNSLGDHLQFFKGNPAEVLRSLCEKHSISTVCWSGGFEPWQRDQEKAVSNTLKSANIETHSVNSSLLWDPEKILKKDGTPYRVFTPFYEKGCLQATPPEPPLPICSPSLLKITPTNTCNLEELNLLPQENWHHRMISNWEVGETGAKKTLQTFLKSGITRYKEGRNYPATDGVSRLSPHLHFGELSVRQIWQETHHLPPDHNTEHFLRELGWREFSYNLLLNNPDLPTQNLQEKFDRFPWKTTTKHLRAWQQGQTGIPIIDAGMRELWKTGYMHNRVRMIVGSFLVKNLATDWRTGAAWFWDCLLDADLANNSASWQWIAGCGADAAPFFRIFNPITQSQKFDPEGTYLKHHLPELKNLPSKHIHTPWTTPKEILETSNITLGQTYPNPIVDLKATRQAALDAFASLKK